MKRCPYCAEEIQDAAILCRYCGSSLTISPPVSAAQRGETNRGAAPASSFSLSAVLFGWIVSEGLAFCASFVLSYWLSNGTLNAENYTLWINILGVAAIFIGGLVTGTRAQHDGLRHGAALAALVFASSMVGVFLLNTPVTLAAFLLLSLHMIAAVVGTLFVTN